MKKWHLLNGPMKTWCGRANDRPARASGQLQTFDPKQVTCEKCRAAYEDANPSRNEGVTRG